MRALGEWTKMAHWIGIYLKSIRLNTIQFIHRLRMLHLWRVVVRFMGNSLSNSLVILPSYSPAVRQHEAASTASIRLWLRWKLLQWSLSIIIKHALCEQIRVISRKVCLKYRLDSSVSSRRRTESESIKNRSNRCVKYPAARKGL